MIPHDVIVVAFETETLAGAGEGGAGTRAGTGDEMKGGERQAEEQGGCPPLPPLPN